MTQFKKIALMRNIKADYADLLDQLYTFLQDSGREIFPEISCRNALSDSKLKFYSYEQLKDCDLAVVVGGDGTLLNAARAFAPYQVPIVGINLGRLGFLVDISPKNMTQSLEEIFQGKYTAEKRFLLQVEVVRDGNTIAEQLALNDVIINNYLQTRMIEFITHVNDRYINHERADGILVTTPTGSTAYALSAGGPILHPSLSALALVPICPHTLNHRPLVIDASSTITIEIDPDCQTVAQVSFDGHANIELAAGDRVNIRRSDAYVKLLHPEGHEFFDILRAKLNWGKQPDSDILSYKK